MEITLLVSLAVCINLVSGQNEMDFFIAGGTVATASEFPFMVSLQQLWGEEFYHACGGFIYDRNFIITAAHCVYDKRDVALRIVAGSTKLTSMNGDEQIRSAEKIIIHPLFKLPDAENDLAIIKLDAPLVFNSNVAPIRIDQPGSFLTLPQSEVYAAGWGVIKFGGMELPNHLQKVVLKIVSNHICDEMYAKIGFSVSNSMICAVAPKGVFGGTCQGDSGGPLFTIRRPYTAVGIVSWGVGCAEPDFPGVYTRLASFNKFIKRVTSSG